MLRTLLFFSVLLAILGGSLGYLARRSMALCPPLARHPYATWSFFLAFVVLVFLVPLLNRIFDHRLEFLYALSWGLFGFISTFLVYLLVADLGQFLLRRFGGAPIEVGRVAFWLALGATGLSLSIGLVQALSAPRLREVRVPIENLDPRLEGFRIVQISDLHLGPLVSPRSVARLTQQTNALAPDLLAITGDLADGHVESTRSKAERMRPIQARHGTFFVTGNHEYYAGVAAWLPVIRSLGWQVLDNTHKCLVHNGASLTVAGMPDPTAGGRRGATGPARQGPDLAKALAGAPEQGLRLLLFHPPTGFESAERSGIHLQLSGHTHAGQYFPWSLVVPRLFRFPRGLGRFGQLWIYTSVGTGYWGPPNRFLVPPELTLLVLERSLPGSANRR